MMSFGYEGSLVACVPYCLLLAVVSIERFAFEVKPFLFIAIPLALSRVGVSQSLGFTNLQEVHHSARPGRELCACLWDSGLRAVVSELWYFCISFNGSSDPSVKTSDFVCKALHRICNAFLALYKVSNREVSDLQIQVHGNVSRISYFSLSRFSRHQAF